MLKKISDQKLQETSTTLTKGEKYWIRQKELGQKAAARIPQVEIWQDDSEAFETMISAICTYENRRAWSEITHRWLKANNKLLIDKEDAEKEFEEALRKMEFKKKMDKKYRRFLQPKNKEIEPQPA